MIYYNVIVCGKNPFSLSMLSQGGIIAVWRHINIFQKKEEVKSECQPLTSLSDRDVALR